MIPGRLQRKKESRGGAEARRRINKMNFDQFLNEITDNNIPLSTILRKAYIFFSKTDKSEIITWLNNELNGYDTSLCKNWEDFPEYRKPHGQLQGSFLGIIKPIGITGNKGKEIEEKLSRLTIHYPIEQIETIISGCENQIQFSLMPKVTKTLQQSLGNITPFVEYSKDSFVAIINHVRNELLKQTLANENILRKSDIDDSAEGKEPLIHGNNPDKNILQNTINLNISNEGRVNMTNDFNKAGGDIVYGDKAGGDINKISAMNIMNSFNKISDSLSPQMKELFAILTNDLTRMCEKMPQEKAEEVARDFDCLINEAKSQKPRKQWYELSAQGLIEAAKTVKEFSEPVIKTVTNILTIMAIANC